MAKQKDLSETTIYFSSSSSSEDWTEKNQPQEKRAPEVPVTEAPPNIAVLEGEISCPSWFIQIMEEVEETETNQPVGPKIPKVPDKLLKSENHACYTPLMVSIGPYHRFDRMERLKKGESLKAPLARRFVRESGLKKEQFYWAAKKAAKEARGFYDERLTEVIDDEDFAKMMVIDGCFVLQFIYCVTGKYDIKMSDHEITLVRRDLLLLENQLPCPVLESLMDLRFGRNESVKMIHDFLPIRKPHVLSMSVGMHILFLSYSLCFGCLCFLDWLFKSCLLSILEKRRKAEEKRFDKPAHLLEILHSRFIREETESIYSGNRGHFLYYSAKDLKKVGIHFRPSRTSALTDVQFKSSIFTGTLKLPPITIDQSTKSMLLNLVAYESSVVPKEMQWVTSYICFMDSLINDAEDVWELRSKGILYNYLGSDEDVAKIFNNMTRSLDPHTRAYNEVKRKINEQCESIFKKWVAQVLDSYFSNPWAFIAPIAAVFTIFLTAVATYIAVWPNHKR